MGQYHISCDWRWRGFTFQMRSLLCLSDTSWASRFDSWHSWQHGSTSKWVSWWDMISCSSWPCRFFWMQHLALRKAQDHKRREWDATAEGLHGWHDYPGTKWRSLSQHNKQVQNELQAQKKPGVYWLWRVKRYPFLCPFTLLCKKDSRHHKSILLA